MRKSTKYFWLYAGALGLTVFLVWLGIHFSFTNKWLVLLFLLPDALAWAGWKVRREVPEEERFQISHILRSRVGMIMESFPILLLLGIFIVLIFE